MFVSSSRNTRRVALLILCTFSAISRGLLGLDLSSSSSRSLLVTARYPTHSQRSTACRSEAIVYMFKMLKAAEWLHLLDEASHEATSGQLWTLSSMISRLTEAKLLGANSHSYETAVSELSMSDYDRMSVLSSTGSSEDEDNWFLDIFEGESGVDEDNGSGE
ncbi:hypothetical protein BDQ12DRAFT_694547 [Crucibulum laeve]|uniref:Uncharacterized protein n=1 Tax=Crucibulum laeve TaxID=68775 RepID=A0A5C3LEF8_9AGAR|nr:hypothetical protein BDQ12DRAFT_694547 [Crucibulum laeve]